MKAMLKSIRRPKLLLDINKELIFGTVLSFLLGRTVMAKSLAPFGVGFFAGARLVMPGQTAIVFGLCSLLGSVSILEWDLVAHNFLSMLLLTLLLRKSRVRAWNPNSLDYIFIGGIAALSKATVNAVLGFSLQGYISAAIEGICVGLVAFLAQAANEKNPESAIVLGLVALGGLQGIALMGIRLENILIMAVILFAGFVKGPSVGSVVGLSGGLILALTGSEEPLIIGISGISGLLAGVGGLYGKAESLAGFLSAGLLMSFYGTSALSIGSRLVEQFLASVPLMFLTTEAHSKLASLFTGVPTEDTKRQRTAPDAVSLKMAAVAHTLFEIGDLFNGLNRVAPLPDDNSVSIRRIAEKVCKTCPRQDLCWEENFAQTFRTVTELLESENIGLDIKTTDELELAGRCQNFGDMVSEAKHIGEINRLEKKAGAIGAEVRGCLAYQYRSLAGLLIGKDKSVNGKRPSLKLSLCGKSVPAKGAQKIGDSWDRYDIDSQRTLVLLADGMGKGDKAARQSKETVSLLKSLLDCGLDFDSCVAFLNSALFLAWHPDSFIALDCLLLDNSTKKAYFHKLGAPPSFIKKKSGAVLVVRGVRPPAGAMKEIPAPVASESVEAGDVIFLVSDGVYRSSPVPARAEHLLISRLRRMKDSDLEASVRSLAGNRYRAQPEDDVTVVGIRIEHI